ncbi:hypothetical protein [Streptomyces sp. MJP52]|uniref:hypothetical protein n=1 Tax=Streptomyces sp. MJP52 TaxID=2940555 RepID=UPI002474276A|nr:hypothetical protein [Streptomyces sp. MJP52]MDH6228168.1 hypothetical protein [Streptomyces sp. MJP52]
MGKSARVLGSEFGRTAREMNELLKEHGYLYGEPGAYGLTEKGQQYGEEQHHSRGTGGYAHYNRNWETRTWNDETAAALRADMAANPGGFGAPTSPTEEEDSFDDESFDGRSNNDDNDAGLSGAGLVIGGVVVGVLLLAPHVKPFWDNKVKPGAKKLRDKLSRGESGEAADT